MCIVNLWNSLTEEVTESNTMAEFKKQLGNFMTTNSFGSSAQQAEIMIRVIKSLVSGCKLPMRGLSNSMPYFCPLDISHKHPASGSCNNGHQCCYSALWCWSLQMPMCSFTFIWNICLCNVGAGKTGLGNSTFHNDSQDNLCF